MRIVAGREFLEIRQKLHADIRREHDGDDPRCQKRDGNHPEDAAGIFAHRGIGETDRQKAGRRHQRPGQHRERGGFPGKGRGANAIPALLHFHHHHLDGDDGIVDQKAERDDQCPERDPVQIETHGIHDDENDREHQRHRQRHHDAGAPAEREEAYEQHDRKRFHERVDELVHRVIDDLRLIGDLLEIEALRHRGHEVGGCACDIRTEFKDIGALGHHNADANGLLAFLADLEVRRIGKTMGHGGDVTDPEYAAVGFHRRLGDSFDAVERAGDAQRHALRRGLQHAGRHDRVLPGQRLEQLIGRDAERRELGVREFDEDLLVLRAVQIDLGDVLDLEQALTERLGDLFHLRIIGAVGGQHVEDRIDVAPFVIDRRPDQSGRQIVLDVGELLAKLVEELRHVAGRRVVLERDLHRREAGFAVGRDLVDEGQLLHLLFDRIGDLRLHFRGCRARPHGGDDHELDGERRIFAAPQAAVGEQAGGAEHHDQEKNQSGMRNGPRRDIETAHRALPLTA